MNARRVAALLRMRADLAAKMAEVDGELAAAFCDAEPANETDAATKPKRISRAPSLVRIPAGVEPTSLDQVRAKAALRKLGYRT